MHKSFDVYFNHSESSDISLNTPSLSLTCPLGHVTQQTTQQTLQGFEAINPPISSISCAAGENFKYFGGP